MLFLKLLLCILGVVITIFLALFARAMDRLAATSVVDALNAVNLFRRGLADDLRKSRKTLDEQNISGQELQRKVEALSKRPLIVKYGPKVIQLFVMIVGFTIIFWDFYIGAVQPSIAEVTLPIIACWATFTVCIIAFFAIEIHAFIALPRFIYSIGGRDVLIHIKQIRLKLILTACSWGLCITAAFGTLFGILSLS